MNDPVFVLGAPRSGGSVVAGLLHVAGGLAIADPLPPTVSQPFGCFESRGIVEAHRDLLRQIDRDVTCPPSELELDRLDLSQLAEAVDAHRAIPQRWVVKEPSTSFLLPAWAACGIERAHLIAVVRSPFDTIASIESHDQIRSDRAELIVERALRRLSSIAADVELTVVRFDGSASVIDEVRSFADSIDLTWDEALAGQFFEPRLVSHRSAHVDTTPSYDDLVERCASPEATPPSGAVLSEIHSVDRDAPQVPRHLGPRYVERRRELLRWARLGAEDGRRVVEVVLEGAQSNTTVRAGGNSIDVVHVRDAEQIAPALLGSAIRPDVVVATGVFDSSTPEELSSTLSSVVSICRPFADLIVEFPESSMSAPSASSSGEPLTPDAVIGVAQSSGLQLVRSDQISPRSHALAFRKSASSDVEITVAVDETLVTEARRSRQRAETTESESRIRVEAAEFEVRRHRRRADAAEYDAQRHRRRAEAAEGALRRIQGRRSVRLAVRFASLSAPIVRAIRTQKR